MPGVVLDMDDSDNATPASRRKSGRVTHKPEFYQAPSSPAVTLNGSAKRKRFPNLGDHGDDGEDDDRGETSSAEEGDEPDEEEVKEQKRKRAVKSKGSARPPAAKKPKTAGGQDSAMQLPMRPATKTARRPDPKRSRAKKGKKEEDASGLYAELFSQDNEAEELATTWVERYKKHDINALTDLVNLILRCSGCPYEVEGHDIEDPDNAATKLQELQEDYQAQDITDYPLIAKANDTAFSRQTMTTFFHAIIESAHASGILYDDMRFIETIEIWVSSMSSSANRPFRHTATVIALTISSALCDRLKEVEDSSATTTRQREGEAKKKSANKGRIASLKKKLEENAQRKQVIEEQLKDFVDTVFAHRYRDVHEKIRAECMASLGYWISTCPDMFFEGLYVRHFGWLLSDRSKEVRAEVLGQLLKLYRKRDNVGRLRAFTEKFRPRMVEMATRDSDVGIRSHAIALLDRVREMGLLEPDDIDTIGRLVYDSEARVRRAVAGFFAENIKDTLQSAVEDLGGDEALDEALASEEDEEYEVPHKTWLWFKAVAEVLSSYDAESQTPEEGGGAAFLSFNRDASRHTVAAQVACEGISAFSDWEALAGYLLCDLSNPETSGADEVLTGFLTRCKLEEKEEKILLELLRVAIEKRLNDAQHGEGERKGRSSKARQQELREVQESTALALGRTIPKLLQKFGADPSTSAAVLRLEPILNLEVFQELRQDSSEFASLLEDVNRQFLTHADRGVLAEAGTALLHARGNEDLSEVTDRKVQELWDDVSSSIRRSTARKTRLDENLAGPLQRLAMLSTLFDCRAALDSTPPKKAAPTLQQVLFAALASGREHGDEHAVSCLESAMSALLYYHMWNARAIRLFIDAGKTPSPPESTDLTVFAEALQKVASDQLLHSQLRRKALTTLLDLHTLYATFRNVLPQHPNLSDLIKPVSRPAAGLVKKTFVALEGALYKTLTSRDRKGKPKLARETPQAVDDAAAPEDSDSEAEEAAAAAEEDEEQGQKRARDGQAWAGKKREQKLLAEQRLCEFGGKCVLAVVAKVLDPDGSAGVRARMQLNAKALGPNYAAVLAYLEEPQARSKAKARGAAKAAKDPVPDAGVAAEAVQQQEGRTATAEPRAGTGEAVGDDGVSDSDEDEGAAEEPEVEDEIQDDEDGEERMRAEMERETPDEDEIMGD